MIYPIDTEAVVNMAARKGVDECDIMILDRLCDVLNASYELGHKNRTKQFEVMPESVKKAYDRIYGADGKIGEQLFEELSCYMDDAYKAGQESPL